tara:strand:- start:28 stop:288 length:261 start_codon:yes stop_codon:yes gene_type:complete
MITMKPDPREIITFCDHLACMCSKYESLHKTPLELLIDFFQDVDSEDCQFNINDVIANEEILNYGDAISTILNVYYHGIPNIKRLH